MDMARTVAAAALLWLLGACGEQPADTATSSSDAAVSTHGEAVAAEISGVATLRAFGDVRTLNPLTATLPEERKMLDFHVNLNLLTPDPERVEPMPWLAESLPVLDGDRQIWTLREGARWSDGRPVTADDAVFTWETLSSEPLRRTACAATYQAVGGDAIKKVEALDARRFAVTVEGNGRTAMIAFGTAFGLAPRHATPADPEELATTLKLPGTGPYEIEGPLRPERIVLVRKKDWWGDAGHEVFAGRFRVERLVHKVVGDQVQIEEQLRGGLLDLAPLNSVDSYLRLRGAEWDADFERAHYYLPKWSFVGWNCRDALFSDVRVRRAMSHLVPRTRINEGGYGGLSKPVSGPFFVQSALYDPEIEPHRFSPKAALELLAEAGWTDSDDDGLLDREGRAFEFVLTRQGSAGEWADPIVDQWREALKQVGIRMTEERVAYAGGALFDKLSRHDFQAYVLIWGVDPLLQDVRDVYHSSQVAGGYNWQAYASAEADELLDLLRTENDEAARARLARRLHAVLHRDQPMCFLFTNPSCVVWNRRLEGVVAHPLGIRTWDLRVASR